MSRCSDQCTPSSCTYAAEKRIQDLDVQLREMTRLMTRARDELEVMTEDRDDWRRLALERVRDVNRLQISPQFFLVWNANGGASPRYRHPKHGEAKEEAKRLAALHPDQRFYVLGECGYAVSESVQWHCDQPHWDDDDGIPF